MKLYLRDLIALDNKVKKDLRDNYVVWIGRIVCYARSVVRNWQEADRTALVEILNFGKNNNYFLLKSLANIADVYDKRQFDKLLKRLEDWSSLIFRASIDFVCKLLGR